ncbi:MAG TPA: NfeD family protein [Clostridiales bacterium]|nr:NfeD family protein [Clostridiales bacterium]
MDPYVMPFIWLGVALVMGVTEAFTAQLVSIWFVLGSIAAAVSCIFTSNIPLQIGIFLAVSIVAVLITRPFVKKFTRVKPTCTNSDRYIGETGEVIIEINNLASQGQVNVKGAVWSARTNDNSVVPSGTLVTVDKIEGVKLIVRPKITVGVE